jgi:hypothetical protein
MLPTLILTLVVAIVMVGAVAVAAFLESAFWDERRTTEQIQNTLAWRPPFLRGEGLRAWAASIAERVAARCLSGERNAKTAVQLTTEVAAGVEHAMLPFARQAELERIVPCPEWGQGAVGVTAPEALTVANYLRTHLSHKEQKQVLETATANVQKLAAMRRGELAYQPLQCPLEGHDRVCCAYEVRPLDCRPLHAISVARSMHHAHQPQETGSAPWEHGRHEFTVEQGVQDGVMRALENAGLEAQEYELNDALVVALGEPDAAERWAEGERVFGKCFACRGQKFSV